MTQLLWKRTTDKKVYGNLKKYWFKVKSILVYEGLAVYILFVDLKFESSVKVHLNFSFEVDY